MWRWGRRARTGARPELGSDGRSPLRGCWLPTGGAPAAATAPAWALFSRPVWPTSRRGRGPPAPCCRAGVFGGRSSLGDPIPSARPLSAVLSSLLAGLPPRRRGICGARRSDADVAAAARRRCCHGSRRGRRCRCSCRCRRDGVSGGTAACDGHPLPLGRPAHHSGWRVAPAVRAAAPNRCCRQSLCRRRPCQRWA